MMRNNLWTLLCIGFFLLAIQHKVPHPPGPTLPFTPESWKEYIHRPYEKIFIISAGYVIWHDLTGKIYNEVSETKVPLPAKVIRGVRYAIPDLSYPKFSVSFDIWDAGSHSIDATLQYVDVLTINLEKLERIGHRKEAYKTWLPHDDTRNKLVDLLRKTDLFNLKIPVGSFTSPQDITYIRFSFIDPQKQNYYLMKGTNLPRDEKNRALSAFYEIVDFYEKEVIPYIKRHATQCYGDRVHSLDCWTPNEFIPPATLKD